MSPESKPLDRVCLRKGCDRRPKPGAIYCSKECARQALRVNFVINPERRAAALRKAEGR